MIEKALFGDDVMLAAERKSYATNLATYAANLVSAKGAAKEALMSARRIIALSLNLERRNKQPGWQEDSGLQSIEVPVQLHWLGGQ